MMSRVRRRTRKGSRRKKGQKMEVIAQQRQSLTMVTKVRVRIALQSILMLRATLKVCSGDVQISDCLWRLCFCSRGGLISV